MLDITPDIAAQEISASTRRDRRKKRWKCLCSLADRSGGVTVRIRPAASQARRLGYRRRRPFAQKRWLRQVGGLRSCERGNYRSNSLRQPQRAHRPEGLRRKVGFREIVGALKTREVTRANAGRRKFRSLEEEIAS